ncbi:TMEM175 family protein [Hymenobacter cellulosilyticus]|uniref:TMEM175 family protein n=1 Tax=Hymenobacter cellulosilyticus TaxID=2932248 RepID=A0A8T9Q7Q0_9BACT|nr:TMEM175 family protein [Hymenobacter cellulosilyticus]UOQ73534.1 TMEM175 family protein [Hymenobacter cellulosilyticus]
MILFTDAVFAIAITLLIIEIKVPEVHGAMTEEAAIEGLLHLIPKFVGFIIGFFVIAIYWVAHHRIFRFAHHYNGKLVWLNILFLFSIVLMPFTSAFYTEYTTNINTPFILYCGSVAMTGLLQCLLQSYLRNPKNGLINPASVGHPDLDLVRPLIAPSAFLIGILLVFIAPWWVSRNVPVLIWPLMALYNRRYHRLQREYAAKHQAVAA